jgi:hypothetical protein
MQLLAKAEAAAKEEADPCGMTANSKRRSRSLRDDSQQQKKKQIPAG